MLSLGVGISLTKVGPALSTDDPPDKEQMRQQGGNRWRSAGRRVTRARD
jgi:hypothetical protein